MATSFLGVVSGVEPNDLEIALLDVERQTLEAKSFSLKQQDFRDYFVEGDSAPIRLDPNAPDLCPIDDFLADRLQGKDPPRVLIEVPKLLPHPDMPEHTPPYALLDYSSPQLRLIAFLSMRGLVTWMFAPSENVMIIEPMPAEYQHLRSRTPKLIPAGSASAFADVIFGTSDSPSRAAGAATLIAKNRGAFHYWASSGLVQSSQDVVSYLRMHQPTPTAVIAASESFWIARRPDTVQTDHDRIPLEYAVARKRYGHLYGHQAEKVALLHVCKLWNVDLRCTSFREDAENRDEDVAAEEKIWDDEDDDPGLAAALPAVFPEPADSWICEAISKLENQRLSQTQASVQL